MVVFVVMPKKVLKDYIVKALEGLKVENVEVFDTRDGSIADYVVIGSGRSSKHLESSMDTLRSSVKKDYFITGMMSGNGDNGWILLDLGSIIVHLFTPDVRDLYKLEELLSPQVRKMMES